MESRCPAVVDVKPSERALGRDILAALAPEMVARVQRGLREYVEICVAVLATVGDPLTRGRSRIMGAHGGLCEVNTMDSSTSTQCSPWCALAM